MKKIIIAYHAYLFGNSYMDMIVSQLRAINNAKWKSKGTEIEDLMDYEHNILHYADKLYIGIVDSENKNPRHGVEWLTNWFKNKSSKIIDGVKNDKIEIVVYPTNNEETDTLRWVRDYARDNPGDYVLYFHTKGITQYSEATESWRLYMQYFVVDRWKDCIAKLEEGFDCCGVMWNKETPLGYWPHFSGNFWWATTDYINTLDHSYLDHPWRYMREFWIGSNPNVKACELHNSGYNTTERLESHRGHYDIVYDPSNYKK
jgi:hypothetical protein